MWFKPLEDNHLGRLDVPGTVYLYVAEDSSPEQQEKDAALKRVHGIILNPQPHDDPNDPLVLKTG